MLPPLPPLLANRSNSAAIWRVAWPSVVIGLLRAALGQVDAWYIGRLGSAQLQAISAASFLVWTVYIAGELSSVGVHALSSAAEGAGDRREGVGAAVVQGLWFAVGASLLMAAMVTGPRLAAYFRVVGVTEPSVVNFGSDYARVTAVWGTLPLSAEACALAGFKGIGETRPALAIAALTVLLNAALNGPFIRRYGVAGAAWATNLSAAVGCVAALAMLIRRGVRLRLRKPSLSAARRIGAIGAPLASSGLLFSCVYMALGRTLASLSPAYLAALGIGHRIEAMAYTACEGYAVGSATVIGQYAGAQRPQSAVKAASAAARVAVATMLPILVLVFFGATPAVRLFSSEPLVVTAAAQYLRIVALLFPIMAIDAVYEGALTGVQQTLPVLLVGVVGNLLRVPLAIGLLPRFGVKGVWLAIAISTVLKAPVKWLCFRRAPKRVSVTI